jgi:hypothetical protein
MKITLAIACLLATNQAIQLRTACPGHDHHHLAQVKAQAKWGWFDSVKDKINNKIDEFKDDHKETIDDMKDKVDGIIDDAKDAMDNANGKIDEF